MRRFDVTLAGLVILDVLGFPVATIPPKGTVDFMESLRLTVAGPAGGTAVDCAKLGLHTALVGVIGTDEAGDVVKGLLGRYGVDPRFLKMTDTVATSSSMVFVSHTGQRPALHARGASDCLTINDLPESSYAAKVFHMGGTGLLRGMDGMPTREALSRARKSECITTFDLVGARAEIAPDVMMCLPFVDYFMPSIEEARILCGLHNTDDVVEFFLDQGVSTCVLTLGEEGVVIQNRSERLFFPAYDVPVVDTTGCGDAFSAGFILGLVKGFDWELAARFASACAALVATGVGSDAGIQSYEHVWEVMHSWPLRAPKGNIL